MPDRQAEQVRNTDPIMGTIVLGLIAFIAAIIALALGLSWKGLLHWTGELLLIIGIALAAIGISDVRREWTRRLGIRGNIKQKAQAIRVRAASFLWARWNRVVEWDWLAKRLHLRPHHRRTVEMSGGLRLEMSATGSLQVGWGPAPAGGTTEERLAWLEDHMADAGRQLGALNAWRMQEVTARQAAAVEEKAARMAEDQRIRDRMADLAGGGLRLQAWGVACLLAGTVITAIW